MDRDSRSEKRLKRIMIWYGSGAVLIILTLIIGGVTRLTDSGLSIVEWKPILGIIPPTSEAQWQEAFDQYRQYPEYQQRNLGMSLSEFQFIYFWEYLHRMAGRAVALVFFVPFAMFLWFRSFDRRQTRRALLLLALGASQGLMGWYMVQSGLVDQPWVSHYRLAAHLMLAILLFICCIWFAMDLRARIRWKDGDRQVESGTLRKLLWGVVVLVAIQIVWGAFVAGLKAGHLYNTFPLMNHGIFPSGMWQLDPWNRNLLDNPGTVQWVHRWLGVVITMVVIGLWASVRKKKRYRTASRWAVGLNVLVLFQVLLGIVTLLLHVPLFAAVLHQVVAALLLGYLIIWIHQLRIYDPDTDWQARWLGTDPE